MDCTHAKPLTTSSVKTGHVTKISQYCDECKSVRDREIFSARLGVADSPSGTAFTCFSDSTTPWVPPMVINE